MKPVAIIGGGIAALGAAMVLRHAGVPRLIVEAEKEIGGRMKSIRGDGWLTDVGCPYFKLSSTHLLNLVREAGLETDCLALQDAIAEVTNDGHIRPSTDAYGVNRVSLRHGMGSLFDAARRNVPVITGTPIGALKWENRKRAFLLRDNRSGRAVRHPVDQRTVEASGVIVAVPGTAAATIVQGSRFLEPVEMYFRNMEYTQCVVGVFRVPRIDPGFCALRGNAVTGFEWLCFEERKHPSRVAGEWSILTVWGAPSLMENRKSHSDIGASELLYVAAREVLSALPENPVEQHLVRWNAARPKPESMLAIPGEGVPTTPARLPFALAGDYTRGDSAEDAAASGMIAAQQVLRRL